ncbi:cytochrome P450 [Streptomyces sp. CRN 30]|uniref:cytochrome P450 n=1 Tax=Streptomyces sp. CRN 30 TaxID=3075613 RepID=UPI002A8297A9|nr:cytochrome P450 [Streptomyces sp. CRN 30]
MKSFQEIPMAPGKSPVLGHLIPLTRDPLGLFRSVPPGQELLRLRVAATDVLLVCSPSLLDQVLRDDRTFDKGGLLFERAREVIGDGVGSCPHAQHRRQRRLIQPAFHQDRMPGYAKVMTDCVVETTRTWHDGQEIDVLPELVGVTMRILLLTLFSDSLSVQRAREMGKDAGILFKGFYWRMFMVPPFDKLPTPGNRRYRRAHTRLRQEALTIVEERRRDQAEDHGDLLSAMLASRDEPSDGPGPSGHGPSGHGPSGRGLSDDEIVDQVITFLLAGTEITAGSTSWTLYLLAHHPEQRQRAFAEVDAVGRIPTIEDLPALPGLTSVINESLRVYTPGWISSRTTSDDSDLGGHRVPRGTTIIFSPYLIHHQEALYPDPETFDPRRWEEPGGAPAERSAYIPFGAGARKCVGDRFALTEVALLLAAILSRWQLDEAPSSRPRPKPGTVLTPARLRMRVAERHVRHDTGTVPAPTPG